MLPEQTCIALFVADYFEDLELYYTYYRLIEAGAVVRVIGPVNYAYSGKQGLTTCPVIAVNDSNPGDYDAVVISGGYAPDFMRRSPRMIEFIQGCYGYGKPVAAICYGPLILASAGIIEGCEVTSYSSIRADMVNAGARWVDEPIVSDHRIITSQSQKELPVFCTAILDILHKSQYHDSLVAQEVQNDMTMS